MSVATPRFTVTVAGSALVGIVSVRIRQANAFQCAKFSFEKVFVHGDPNPPAWWTQDGNTAIQVVISVSDDGKSFSPVMTGNVDSHTFDPIHGTISVEGRDLAALMIDQRTNTAYPNLTASEIVTKIAAANGLTAVVTQTTTLAGHYYTQDHTRLAGGDFSRDMSQWDLICNLGQKEGIVPYVMGTTLYFQTPAANPPTIPLSCVIGQIGVTSNCTSLRLSRSLTVAKDVDVTVKSWSSSSKKVVTGHAVTKAIKPPNETGIVATKYTFTVPNLTQAQADQFARQLALDISHHERRISASLPLVVPTGPQYLVTLTGTGTDYDMAYYPETISAEISTRGGMTTIEAKYTSPITVQDAATGQTVAIARGGQTQTPAIGSTYYQNLAALTFESSL